MVPEGEERQKEIENVFEEIMAENFLKSKEGNRYPVQEAQRVPKKMNTNPHQDIPELKWQKIKRGF